MAAVLILGGRAPVALDLARRFARAGWTVHIADSAPCRLAGWSRAVAGLHRLPPPRDDPNAWADALAAMAMRLRVDLVLPTCEEVFYLARYRHRLPASMRVPADDFDLLRTLHGKVEFIALARDCGVDLPPTQRVQTLQDARDWAGSAPLVLKPEFSRFGVHVRLYPRGLPADAPPLVPAGAWAAQHYRPGRELCSYAIADRGRLRAHAAYRPAWRLPGSASFYFEPLRLPPLQAFAAAFVAKTGYTGQIAFDWIEDADGRLTVIECNPRGTSGLHLFAADDDLPAALAGADIAAFVPGHERPAMLAAMMASAGFAEALRRRDVGGWWRDLHRGVDVLAAPGDRRPVAGALRDLFGYARIGLARRIGLRAATTRDIEWNGEELPVA